MARLVPRIANFLLENNWMNSDSLMQEPTRTDVLLPLNSDGLTPGNQKKRTMEKIWSICRDNLRLIFFPNGKSTGSVFKGVTTLPITSLKAWDGILRQNKTWRRSPSLTALRMTAGLPFSIPSISLWKFSAGFWAASIPNDWYPEEVTRVDNAYHSLRDTHLRLWWPQYSSPNTVEWEGPSLR